MPGIFAARLRRGVILPTGRIVGETDRAVHLFPIPTGHTIPYTLRACYGLAIRPGRAGHRRHRNALHRLPGRIEPQDHRPAADRQAPT